jgi:hypothetical protein
LCRIQKFKLKGFEQYYPDIDKLELPLFNKHFYIIPDRSIDPRTNIQNFIEKVPKVELPPIQNNKFANPPNLIGPISKNLTTINPVVLSANTNITTTNTIASIGINSSIASTLANVVNQISTLATMTANIQQTPLNIVNPLAVSSNSTSDNNKPKTLEVTVPVASIPSTINLNVASTSTTTTQKQPGSSTTMPNISGQTVLATSLTAAVQATTSTTTKSTEPVQKVAINVPPAPPTTSQNILLKTEVAQTLQNISDTKIASKAPTTSQASKSKSSGTQNNNTNFFKNKIKK